MKTSVLSNLHYIHTFEKGERAKRAKILLEDYYKRRNLDAKLDKMALRTSKLITVGIPYAENMKDYSLPFDHQTTAKRLEHLNWVETIFAKLFKLIKLI